MKVERRATGYVVLLTSNDAEELASDNTGENVEELQEALRRKIEESDEPDLPEGVEPE